MNKEEIRKEILAKRNKLNILEILDSAEKIEKKLFDLKEFQNAKTIACYVSKGSEVFTYNIILHSLEKGKKIVAYYTNFAKKELELIEFQNFDSCKKNEFGVLEPIDKKIFSPEKVDLFVVPGVGFDEEKNRLGHGKGYIDKLLSKLKNRKAIGLSYEIQIVSKLPATELDQKVDFTVTEKRVI